MSYDNDPYCSKILYYRIAYGCSITNGSIDNYRCPTHKYTWSKLFP